MDKILALFYMSTDKLLVPEDPAMPFPICFLDVEGHCFR